MGQFLSLLTNAVAHLGRFGVTLPKNVYNVVVLCYQILFQLMAQVWPASALPHTSGMLWRNLAYCHPLALEHHQAAWPAQVVQLWLQTLQQFAISALAILSSAFWVALLPTTTKSAVINAPVQQAIFGIQSDCAVLLQAFNDHHIICIYISAR